MKPAGVDDVFKVILIKLGGEFPGLEQMSGGIVAPDKKLQFVEVLRPAKAVEKLDPIKLGFVEGFFGIARAQVDVTVGLSGKKFHRRGHHKHAEVAIGSIGVFPGDHEDRVAFLHEVPDHGIRGR